MGRPAASSGFDARAVAASLQPWPAAGAGHVPVRRLLERAVAAGYGLTYDAIVRPFVPYQALLGDIVELIQRSEPARRPSAVRVLDAACGTGTVALRLAREGYAVVGVDTVAPLVDVARARAVSPERPNATFHHLDLVRDTVPGAGTFDVAVSMHTLYWHPDPAGLLAACLRALKPGGHAIFLTYSRPARVVTTFRAIWTSEGFTAALHALRWLIPTAAFEMLRHYTPHYVSQEAFHRALSEAGFEILESRRTFLAQLSVLAWVQKSPAVEGEMTR